ncbi:hypothetical protein ACFL01_01010 [Planctomycetota bacterium]
MKASITSHNTIVSIFVLVLAAIFPGSALARPIVFEAEHGVDIKLNYEIAEVKGASGGLALTLKEGAGGTFGYGSNTNRDVFIGTAQYDFTIEEAGPYFISARVFWMDKCGNLVHLSIDGSRSLIGLGSPDKKRETFQKWYWQRTGPVHLTKGSHTLISIAREDGPMIDRWSIHKAEEQPSDKLETYWPGTYSDAALKKISVSVSKPSELIGEDGTHTLTVWARKCTPGPAEGTIVVKGPADVSIKPQARFPIRFKADETLKRFDLKLTFPKKSPRSEKKFAVCAMDKAGAMGSVALCILAKPYDWWVRGTVPGESRIEEELAFGKNVNLTESWKRVPPEAFNPYQTIDLEKVYGPSIGVAAYLYTKIRVEKTGEYLLMANNDGALDVWIDGEVAYADPSHHPAVGWLHQLPIELKEGDHTILARIRQNEPPDTDYQQNYWLFRLRFRKRRKEPAPIGGIECGKVSASAPWQ